MNRERTKESQRSHLATPENVNLRPDSNGDIELWEKNKRIELSNMDETCRLEFYNKILNLWTENIRLQTGVQIEIVYEGEEISLKDKDTEDVYANMNYSSYRGTMEVKMVRRNFYLDQEAEKVAHTSTALLAAALIKETEEIIHLNKLGQKKAIGSSRKFTPIQHISRIYGEMEETNRISVSGNEKERIKKLRNTTAYRARASLGFGKMTQSSGKIGHRNRVILETTCF